MRGFRAGFLNDKDKTMSINLKTTTIKLFKVATFALALFSILPALSSIIWPLELFSHFYAQYALMFLGFTLLWLILRQPKLIVFSVLGFGLSFVMLLPFYYKPQVTAKPKLETQTPLTLVFNNLNYGTTNFTPLLNYVTKEEPQVVALVEVSYAHFQTLKKSLKANYPYSFHQSGVKQRLGIVIFSQKPFSRKPYIHYFGGSKYPAVEVNFKLKDEPNLSLIVIHPPPPMTKPLRTERDLVLKGLADYLSKRQIRTVVIGDFNATGFSPNFRRLVKEGRVTDARQGEGISPSWPTQLPKLMRIPIDHALVTKDVQVVDFTLGPNTGSDHLPFSLSLLIP